MPVSDEVTAVRLVEEALYLRMYGERAPGGNETWHGWERKAEMFLRDQFPPEDAIASVNTGKPTRNAIRNTRTIE